MAKIPGSTFLIDFFATIKANENKKEDIITYPVPSIKISERLLPLLKLIINAPEMVSTNPKASRILNFSFNNRTPKVVTKTGVIFPKKETMAGFSTLFIAMKKKVVPTSSKTPIKIKAR